MRRFFYFGFLIRSLSLPKGRIFDWELDLSFRFFIWLHRGSQRSTELHGV